MRYYSIEQPIGLADLIDALQVIIFLGHLIEFLLGM